MRIIILSDIHSNLHALEAVLADAKQFSPERYYCLGDIIGYCAFPKKCLEIVRELCEHTVFGNHEYALLYPEHAGKFNPEANRAVQFSENQLDDDDIDWLRTLEPTLIIDDVTIAHGSLRDFDEYVSDSSIARLSIEVLKTKILFVGHTHYPEGYAYNLENRSTTAMELFVEGKSNLPDNHKFLINAGSVGQPRDGDSRATYALYDTDESSIHIIRVKYDINSAADAIREAELPDFLAKRLYMGR